MDFIDVMIESGVASGVGVLVGMQREYAKRDDLEGAADPRTERVSARVESAI